MKIIASLGKDHYKTILRSETNLLIADEIAAKGGNDEGFTPHELFAAALASCTSITLRMYADRKEWDLAEINVTVNINKEAESHSTLLTCEIELLGDLTDEQKSRLLIIANHCPIHNILSNPVRVNTKLK